MCICDRCIHDEVCGLEDNHEEAMTFCADMMPKTRHCRDNKLMEKVERLREISKEIKELDDLLFMYERDKIDLALLKKEVFEIIATL